MPTIQIGFAIADVSLAIKQGSSGSCLLTAVVTQEDGSALPSYSGWTAKLALCRTPQSAPEITLSPTVVGDVPNKAFKITVAFLPATTATVPVGTLQGDVLMTPPGGTDEYYAGNVTLEIERSYTTP
jgi:hypothetical protein